MILWDNVFFIYTCFICASTFNVNAYAHVCNCFFVQVLLVLSTHASYVCTLAFVCKYLLSSIHMLLMHVFHVHLLFVQVFFIVHTHVSYSCISWTLTFCVSIFYRPYTCFLCMYFMDTCFLCKYFFYCPYTCFLCMYFMYTCFLCKYFLSPIHMLVMHVFLP